MPHSSLTQNYFRDIRNQASENFKKLINHNAATKKNDLSENYYDSFITSYQTKYRKASSSHNNADKKPATARVTLDPSSNDLLEEKSTYKELSRIKSFSH